MATFPEYLGTALDTTDLREPGGRRVLAVPAGHPFCIFPR